MKANKSCKGQGEISLFFNRSKDRFFYQVLVDATSNIIQASQLFRENVETLADKEKYAEKIKELESKGDEYTHLLIRELNQTFVTPLDREDILELAVKIDDVLDGIEASAARFVYLHIDYSTPYLVKFGEIIEICAGHLQEAFQALEKRNYTQVRKLSIEINKLENQGDKLMREGISEMLLKKDIDILELIKMKEVYEKLEDVTDTFEDLFGVLEGVVMKYA
jgi:predicted phosphate transport protein (TIGR00153 family)